VLGELHKMELLVVAGCQLLTSMKLTWKWSIQEGIHPKFMEASHKEIEINSKM
jgi:hypothetical protein